MVDGNGRNIDYMRVSVTDRCNLRCRYCMPGGVDLLRHSDVLRYEELLRLCAVAVSLGIVKFKVTGGEPFTRRGCTGFIKELKALPGVEQVTLTTNGLLLEDYLDALCDAGIDGVNISIDTLDDEIYRELTGCTERDMPKKLRNLLTECVRRGLRTKVNAVLLEQIFENIAELGGLARHLPLDVRFIELMPVGEAAGMRGVGMPDALKRLREFWPDLHAVDEKRGNGPARYYASNGLTGRIGFISAMSHSFCESCNRVRLTSTGILKPCLCYGEGDDLGALLRQGCGEEELRARMRACIEAKPTAHCFTQLEGITEHRAMSTIGG
jgi:cyclic pyranopterin phosphate synthase